MTQRPSPFQQLWRKRVVEPILSQIQQGAHPGGIAHSLSAGAVIAILPVLGVTTLLCALVGQFFRLNPIILQAVNYLLFPVQLILIPPFLFLGERLWGLPHSSLNPRVAVDLFWESPSRFIGLYGQSGLAAVSIWALITPFIYTSLFFLSFPLLNSIKNRKTGDSQ